MIAMKDQVVKRIVLYVVITFVLTWAYWFLISYPLAQNTSEGIASSQMLQLSIAPAMLFPALGVVLTRLITREGFKNVHIAPVVFKKTWKYWLLGWLGPAVLIMVGAALYFLVNPQDFSIEQGILAKQLEAAGGGVLSSDMLQMIIVVQLLVGTFLAPLLNIFTAFGEEWGWRGYLLPHMLQHFKVLPTLLICGVIWGLWHAPVTILGHNYGLGYWGYPVTGILAMCVFCTVMGGLFKLSYPSFGKLYSCRFGTWWNKWDGLSRNAFLGNGRKFVYWSYADGYSRRYSFYCFGDSTCC